MLNIDWTPLTVIKKGDEEEGMKAGGEGRVGKAKAGTRPCLGGN